MSVDITSGARAPACQLEPQAQAEAGDNADSRQMAIHTAQHLLSAILDTYNLPTLSWSMTQFPSLDCPYIELPRGLTWQEVEAVEDRCNELINAGVGVWVETSMQQDGGGVDGDEGDRESRGIPKDYEGVSRAQPRFPLRYVDHVAGSCRWSGWLMSS